MHTYTKEEIINMLQGDSNNNATKKVVLVEKARVKDLSPCWIMTSHCVIANGYVQIGREEKTQYVHRLVLAYVLGKPIPQGYDASHICEVEWDIDSRKCVNPEHIVCESRSDNLKRSPTIRLRPAGWARRGKSAGYATAGAFISREV